MKRTTISLPDDVALALERAARCRATSVSAISREALRAHLGLGDTVGPPAFANLGRSGTTDTAWRLDELIAAEWRP